MIMGKIHHEAKLLDEMKHTRIIRLVDVYEDAEYLHIVMDLYQGHEKGFVHGDRVLF